MTRSEAMEKLGPQLLAALAERPEVATYAESELVDIREECQREIDEAMPMVEAIEAEQQLRRLMASAPNAE